MDTVSANKPFDLEGPRNCRELGGYPTVGGRVTKTHIFLRSDSLDELTHPDEEFLYNYGLRFVIDLRGRLEAVALPDRINRREIEYKNIPLFDGMYRLLMEDVIIPKDRHLYPKTMEEFYVFICDHDQEQIAKVLKDLIYFEGGCALFHCTAGKDRTGIISMLLLEMAHVPEDVIVADYAESASVEGHQVKTEEKFMSAIGGKLIPRGAFESKPSFMEYLISHLSSQYGSVAGYLEQIGITQEDEAALQRKFVVDTEDK